MMVTLKGTIWVSYQSHWYMKNCLQRAHSCGQGAADSKSCHMWGAYHASYVMGHVLQSDSSAGNSDRAVASGILLKKKNLIHTLWHGQGAVVCKCRVTHGTPITCHMLWATWWKGTVQLEFWQSYFYFFLFFVYIFLKHAHSRGQVQLFAISCPTHGALIMRHVEGHVVQSDSSAGNSNRVVFSLILCCFLILFSFIAFFFFFFFISRNCWPMRLCFSHKSCLVSR